MIFINCRGEYEHVFIKRIVDEVSRKLNRPVGLEAHMRNVQSLLDAEFDNKVNMIGIHGIGGKLTVALAIYNLIANQFLFFFFLVLKFLINLYSHVFLLMLDIEVNKAWPNSHPRDFAF